MPIFVHIIETTIMELSEAIVRRHSVRNYTSAPLPQNIVETLNSAITEINKQAQLNIQLITNEPRAFTGIFAYGKFSGVTNYFVMAGEKSADLHEKIGYYGEKLVLLAQQLGLNTCWAGLSYRKIADTYTLNANETILCYIALGYGENQGVSHRIKTIEQISNACSVDTPQWFVDGCKAALLAPTAINQQKFRFEYAGGNNVVAKRGFSLVGYTRIDLGIAKLHFEIGANNSSLKWINE